MAILTFKYLRELQKSEKDSALLQKIDPGFYDACAKCLKTDSSEAENIKPLIKNILDMRERKILTSALQSARADLKPENLLSEEEELFSKSFDAIKAHHIMINGILSGKSHDEKTHPNEIRAIDAPLNNGRASDLLRIRTISNIPSFVAEDMKSYGPFAAGETAEIPKKAAEVLINSKIAEKKD